MGCGPHLRLPCLGSAPLCRRRYVADGQGWPEPGAIEFRWTPVRRRFPIQLGPFARERGEYRVLRRRAGRARRFPRAISKYPFELSEYDGAANAPQLLLRAMAGIWPFGRGEIRLGEGRSLFVPQPESTQQ